MSEEQKTDDGNGDTGEAQDQSTKGKMGDGIKQGLGVLTAFKDALEETIQEARDRGDLSADRAKEVMKDTLEKAQEAAEGARDRLDFATHGELDKAMTSIKERVDALEEKVFGAVKVEAEPTSSEADKDGGHAAE
ncbi:MAG: hypothetical protein AAF389_16555 [Gemmatimonadota bacterium]